MPNLDRDTHALKMHRAGLEARIKSLRRETLDCLLDLRALDHAIRAREPRPEQAAPTRLEPRAATPAAMNWDEE